MGNVASQHHDDKYNRDHDIHARSLDERLNHGEINHDKHMSASRTPRTSVDNGKRGGRGSVDESHAARRSIDLSTRTSLPGKLLATDINVNRDMADREVGGLI